MSLKKSVSDSSENTWNRQRIERTKLILFRCYPLHLLNPLMGFDLFQWRMLQEENVEVNPCPLCTLADT